nr:MAG: hypothetical protein DIU58_17130 [Sphaerobacter thermophilus]
MLSLQQLRTPFTRTQGTERVLEWLKDAGFETTGWQNGRIQKTLVMLLGVLAADLSEVVKALAEFGFNDYASGDPLDEFSWSRYRNRKARAIPTVGPMRLTSTASIPYTIEPGQLLAATASGVTFRNVTGGTLAAGGTLQLTWQAVLAGSSSNVGKHTVDRLLTPLAGVTVANDEGDPWYTVAGTDDESDASIQRRNATKWSRLTVELVAESYENIVREAGARKVKVHDENPRGPGTIDIYCAGESSPLVTAEMEAIQLALSQAAFQTDPNWPPAPDSRAAAVSPTPQPLGITATLYHDPSVSGAAVVAAAEGALEDFLARTPIGGWSYASGLQNVIVPEDIVDILQDIEGVETVILTSPSAPVGVGPLNLVVRNDNVAPWILNTVAVTS